MLKLLNIFSIIAFCKTQKGTTLDDPRVYNYYFYVNTNSQISSNKSLWNIDNARENWINYGINNGLQGCGSYHVLQFLDNYPDIKSKYGNNYTAATLYYLDNPGLMGYTPNGNHYGRSTIADVGNTLYISASKRMGGSIDRFVSIFMYIYE